MNTRIQSYINQFNEIFNGSPWIDETFSKKLDKLTEAQAFTPAPGNIHSVAEIVSHLVVWRNEITRRLVNNVSDRLITDESPENWLPLPVLRTGGWQPLQAALRRSHDELVELLADKDDLFLDEKLADTEWNREYFIAGLLQHDVYHLGQIGLVLKWTK